MKYGGMLTKSPKRESYAKCGSCDIIYQDEAAAYGSIQCPECGEAVERGLTREQAKELADENYKELFS